MARFKYIFFLLFLCFGALNVEAQRLTFSTLSVNDGLSQNTVMAIAQDPLGRIWMGTQDGLNCYDGYDFKVFRHDEHQKTTLGNNFIYSLLADEGRMWIGSQMGLSVYDFKSEQFENYTLSGRPVEVYDVVKHSEDELLLATNFGILSFDVKEKSLKMKVYTKQIAIRTLMPYRDGYLVGSQAGLYTYSPSYGSLNPVGGVMATKQVTSLAQHDGQYWVATYGDGVFLLDERLKLVEQITTKHNPNLASNFVRKLAVDAKGRLWIGTYDGLSLRDANTGEIHAYKHSSLSTDLAHNSIRSIFIDSHDGVWLGTYFGGVSYYHPLAQKFDVLHHEDGRSSLSDNTIGCILEDKNHNLWIGTNDDGVNFWDHLSQRYTVYDKQQGHLLSNNIKCLLPSQNGGVWIGSHGGGLSWVDLNRHTFRHYTLDSRGAMWNSCYSLLEDGNELWVGTLNGLWSFDIRTHQFRPHRVMEAEPRLKNQHINSLMKDSRERVWIGTSAGVYLYDKEQDKIVALNLNATNNEVASAYECAVMYLGEDAEHQVWIGARTGLYRFKEQEKRFERYTVKDGLPNDLVYGILEDDFGRLWISTNSGLACFDVSKNSFRTYTMQDGIANNQFNPHACFKGSDGTFYFGGIGGLTTFNPLQMTDNPFTPSVEILGLEVVDAEDDERVKCERDSLGRILRAKFPSECNIFSVNFVAVNPLAGGRNTYAYKLDGFNTRWYETHERKVTYSNLSPGEYTFKVRAANNDGLWSDEVAEVKIIVRPMWWQTLVARIVWVVLFLGVAVGIIMAVLGRMKMQLALRLERIEKEQIGELSQEKIRFYINLAHELRTPLTLIMSPLEELRHHGIVDKYVTSRLSYIYRNSLRLVHIINQLIDYRKAEQGVFRMRVAEQDVDQIVAEVFSMFEDMAQSRDMDYILNSSLKGEQLPVDRMFVEMILTNLLSNAFKFTPDGGMIRVGLQHDESGLRLSVRDSGRGMDVEEQKRAFERFYQSENEQQSGSGLGLAIVRKVVELHEGKIHLESERGKYTEVVVTLPDKLEQYSEDKRAKRDDVRGSIIRDAVEFMPREWEDVEPQWSMKDEEREAENREVILLAEPNQEVCRYIADHFKKQYDVHCAYDGQEAQEQIKLLEPDMVIADRMLPGVDGLRLCQMIKQNIRTCHIPVVLLSYDGGVEEQIKGIEAGADGYLPMPLSVSLLRAKVQNLLKARYRMRHHYTDDAEIDPEKITSNTMDGDFLKKAIRVVEENMDNEEFSSAEFSKALCMSRSNLHLKMKSITGESSTQFIRKIRFNYACRLILEHKYSISEISSMVGFNSPSYFATSFKKHVGCLPTEYLKNGVKSSETEGFEAEKSKTKRSHHSKKETPKEE